MPPSLKKELPVIVRLAVLEGMEAHEKRCYEKNLCPMKQEADKLKESVNGIKYKMAWYSGGATAASAIIALLIKFFWH